jgi:peptide/nickel transport system ATP-binding protein
MSALIEAVDLHRRFSVRQGLFAKAATLHAVQGVSLAVDEGEVLAVVGESGCGKSTLAKMLIGLLPPSGGAIRIAGRDLASLSRLERARLVQPVFQDPYSSLNPRRRIAETVAQPLAIQRQGDAASQRREAIAMLERVGLPERFADRYPNELSGGQRQRVAIARALVLKPRLVVCDEPTSALDISVQSQILNLLMDLQRDLGLTYLFISHNLAVVEHIASRVAVMYLGRIVEQGVAAQVFVQPRHPYTAALLASALTPEPGLGIPETGLGLAFPDPLNPPPGCGFNPRCPRAGERCRSERPVLAGGVACHHPLGAVAQSV